VSAKSKSPPPAVCRVTYDDGETIDEDLHAQRWRVLPRRRRQEAATAARHPSCQTPSDGSSALAVIATAWLGHVAHARLALPPECFTVQQLTCGPALALRRPQGRDASAAQVAFFAFVTGPARAALAKAASEPSRLRVSVRAGEVYELSFTPVDGPAVDAVTLREAATCVLRALTCYMFTMPEPDRGDLSLHSAVLLGPADDAAAGQDAGRQVSGMTRIPLGYVATSSCAVNFSSYRAA
jgi:hypothetical protein